jgi:hypothetical protein
LVLLPHGAVHVRAGVEGDPPCAFEVIKETPSGALRALSSWLDENAGANFTAVIRGAGGPIVTWSTTSVSTTLYWAATVLGQACAATIAIPPSSGRRERPSAVALREPVVRGRVANG